MTQAKYKKQKQRTFTSLIKRSFSLILDGKWKSLGNYILVESINILNQYNLTFKKLNILARTPGIVIPVPSIAFRL